MYLPVSDEMCTEFRAVDSLGDAPSGHLDAARAAKQHGTRSDPLSLAPCSV